MRIRQVLANAGLIVPRELGKSQNHPRLIEWLIKHYETRLPVKINLKQGKAAKRAISMICNHEIIDKTLFESCLADALTKDLLKRHDRAQKKKLYTNLDHTSELVICHSISSVFYSSPEWMRLRYQAIKQYGNKCKACGRGPNNGVVIHVDHIKPRSVFPELSLTLSNLQILCEECNLGKSNIHFTDWNKASA